MYINYKIGDIVYIPADYLRKKYDSDNDLLCIVIDYIDNAKHKLSKLSLNIEYLLTHEYKYVLLNIVNDYGINKLGNVIQVVKASQIRPYKSILNYRSVKTLKKEINYIYY